MRGFYQEILKPLAMYAVVITICKLVIFPIVLPIATYIWFWVDNHFYYIIAFAVLFEFIIWAAELTAKYKIVKVEETSHD